MEQIKKFLHGKGFALLLTASLLAAAAAGVWAVRALRAELQKSLDGLNAPGTTQQTTPETEPDWDEVWMDWTPPAPPNRPPRKQNRTGTHRRIPHGSSP